MSGVPLRRAVAVIDDGAVERNCRRLRGELGADGRLCAVVKADGYGHGAVECARAALAGGAEWLAVATADEVATLRERLPDASILTMGALTPAELEVVLRSGSDVGVWRGEFAELVAERGALMGVRPRIHVKHDSGMGRLGEPDPGTVLELLERIGADERVELAGLWTHLATADELDSPFFDQQLERFGPVAEKARAAHPGILVHAANSAATLRDPASHFDMVRCGVAIYGLDPFQADPFARRLEPAMELRSYVADAKLFPTGASAGYGRRWRAPSPTWVGVLPIGYGDGVRRALSGNGQVLVDGARHSLVGTVSMDNVTIEIGAEPTVEPGAPAVLIGAQGDDRILCEEVADRIGTINYEVTCGISTRVPRVHVRSEAA
ncbi:MAG: alanine racemase [Solirubrobacterales bacterium]